jgi:hypothetical protein
MADPAQAVDRPGRALPRPAPEEDTRCRAGSSAKSAFAGGGSGPETVGAITDTRYTTTLDGFRIA